ncbi:MAG TPA: YigZ family protein [Syntrophomonadaceae bacterium]|nr:YigZ family protein [Syntrophomonadaceae bacterium]HOQ09827.1 YigZ family protein [Syntrophomonadaceae bacterium]HPU48847.1 YigZ family protein [Syntrophomonadaceae bacterium]
MSYYSVRQELVTELEIKKSRFISWVCPISSPSEAEQVIAASRKRWPGANHYCFAWITREPLMERCSDDGEPSGTAGLPILTVLKNRGLENIILVVVRYFGGILLGASGLIRAYADSARNVLDHAEIVKYEPGLLIQLTVAYSELGLIEHRFLSSPGVELRNIEYGERVQIRVAVSVADWTKWEKRITELTNGQVKFDIIEPIMVVRAGD